MSDVASWTSTMRASRSARGVGTTSISSSGIARCGAGVRSVARKHWMYSPRIAGAVSNPPAVLERASGPAHLLRELPAHALPGRFARHVHRPGGEFEQVLPHRLAGLAHHEHVVALDRHQHHRAGMGDDLPSHPQAAGPTEADHRQPHDLAREDGLPGLDDQPLDGVAAVGGTAHRAPRARAMIARVRSTMTSMSAIAIRSSGV